MKKLFVIMLAAVMIFSVTVSAAEEETQETAVETNAAEEEQTISGYYIVNYAQAAQKINLSILSEPDLVWAAEQADTTIYSFRDDNSCVIYKNGTMEEGTYEYADNVLTIRTEEQEFSCRTEFVDGLLLLRDGETSSLLYHFLIEDDSYITIGDYSVIEIKKENINVTEEMVDSYIQTVLQGQTTSEILTEGVTEDGDLITIAFEGTLEGEDTPFEGGSGEGITVQLGSGALIDTFEEQLTGQKIGSTIEVAVTFPEDYSQVEGLAGKNAVFQTTIQSKTLLHTPQLTDEWVQEYSAGSLPEQMENVEEYRQFCRNYLETFYLHTEMINALAAETTITGYNRTTAQMLVDSITASLAQNAAFYGMSEEDFVRNYGYESVDAYKQGEATYDLNLAMVVNKIMTDQNITYTCEDLDESLWDYMRLSGYADHYTLEEYKEQVGTIGMWIYTNLEYKANLAMKALEERVVLTEEQD